MIKKNTHYIGLDLLRGISGYGVAVTHFFAFMYNSEVSEYISFLFVEFFFVLSGFVLFPQILKIYNNKKNLFIFYKRRWLRTLPLYILSLLIVSIITNNLLSFDFLKYLLLIQNILPNALSNDFFPIVWSLSIEEFFYLLFPIIILIVNKKDLLKFLIYFILSILFLKIFVTIYFDLDFLRKGTFIRFDSIIVGFIARYFYKNLSLFVNSALCFLLLFFYVIGSDFVISNTENYSVKYFFVIYLQILSLLILFFFIKIDEISDFSFLKNFFSLISKQTYSVYLFHIIFIYTLYDLDISMLYKFCVYIFLLFSSSTFIFYFFEKPILDKRPKLT